MDYTTADKMLQGRNREQRKLDNNTYMYRVHKTDKVEDLNSNTKYTFFDNEHIAIALHGHEIIKLYNDGYKISACGWKTVTTKDRLNKYAPISGGVYQRQFQWFIGDNIPFTSIEGHKMNYEEVIQ